MKLKKYLMYALLPFLAFGCTNNVSSSNSSTDEDSSTTTTTTTTTTTPTTSTQTSSSTPEPEVFDFTEALALMDAYDLDAALETVNTYVNTYEGSILDYFGQLFADNDFGVITISQDFAENQRYYEQNLVIEEGTNSPAATTYIEYEKDGAYVMGDEEVTEEVFNEDFYAIDAPGGLAYVLDGYSAELYTILDVSNGKTAEEAGAELWEEPGYTFSSDIDVLIEDGALKVDIVTTVTATGLKQTITETYEVLENGLFSSYSSNFGDYTNVNSYAYNVELDKTFPEPEETEPEPEPEPAE